MLNGGRYMLVMSGKMYLQVIWWLTIDAIDDDDAGECPNNVSDAVHISVKYTTKGRPENAVISAAKWCPMEKCTLLVLGSQYGIQIYDWNGAVLIHEFDFAHHGIGADEKQVIDR